MANGNSNVAVQFQEQITKTKKLPVKLMLHDETQQKGPSGFG